MRLITTIQPRVPAARYGSLKSSYFHTAQGISLWLRERRFGRRMRGNAHTYQSFILSIPKSGRTWHRVMLGYYLTRMADRPAKEALHISALCAAVGIGRTRYTHNGSEFSARLPQQHALVASPIEWAGSNVLLIVRNLPDTLVSAWHHARFRDQRFDGTLSDFIRNENTGVRKLLIALNRWHDQRHLARRFAVISYEQLHADGAQALTLSLQLLGVKDINPQWITDSVTFASLENMRRYENEDFFNSDVVRRERMDERARKVRDGQVGAAGQLVAEDHAYIAACVAELGNPFADCSLPPYSFRSVS